MNSSVAATQRVEFKKTGLGEVGAALALAAIHAALVWFYAKQRAEADDAAGV